MMDLRHGDCYDIIPTLADKSIDLVVTDPPYNFETKGGGFYSKDNPTQRTYTEDLLKLDCCDFNPVAFLNLLKPKLKQIYIYTFCNKTLIADYVEFARQNKCSFDVLVMCKSNPIPAYNNHYLSDLEYIVLIREPGSYFAKEKDIELYRKWYVTSCKKGLHPAEKPVELLEKFVKVSCPMGGVVLDPFMGSGSTGVACMKNNRNFIGIEKEEKYYNMAKNRIENDGYVPAVIKDKPTGNCNTLF